MIFLLVCLTGADALETEDSARVDVILRELDDLRRWPIDLNQADVEELGRLPFLDRGLAEAIVRHRTASGGFRSLDDLIQVPGVTRSLLESVRPFVRIPVRAVKTRPFSLRVRTRTDGFRPAAHELYTQTRVDQEGLRAALITEKDPRERSYLDYWAAGLVTQLGRRVFALGRYDLDLGGGAMLSSLGSFFSTLDFRMISRERGIKPYTSTMENGGFFGAAYSDSALIRYMLFYSNLERDGRIDDEGLARSFDDSGDHADSAGRAHRDRINESLIGYHVRYGLGGFRIGHASYAGSYRPAFAARDSVYDYYGSRYWMTGFDLRYGGPGYLAFSELVRAHRGRIGGIFGIGCTRRPFYFQAAGKYFPRGFFSPKGGEALDGKNVTTITARYRSRIAVLGSETAFRRDLTDDSVRYDQSVWLEKQAGRVDGRFLLRWQWQGSRAALSVSRAIIRVTPGRPVYAEVRLEDRTDHLPQPDRRGFYGGFEIGLDGRWFGLKARCGWFDVDDYACRIIVYEPDLPGVVNNRLFYDQGRCASILAAVKPWSGGELSVKFSVLERDSLTNRVGGQLDVKW